MSGGLAHTRPLRPQHLRLRPTLLAVTPPTGRVFVPGLLAEGRSATATSSWAPLLQTSRRGPRRFALWLRTPSEVADDELKDIPPADRPVRARGAARHVDLLAFADTHEIPYFVGTCAETLEASLAHARASLADVLHDPRLAGFILRGDPDEAALAAVRARLDGLDAARLSIGRSMHGRPLGGPTLADFTIVAPFRPALTAKPRRASVPEGIVERSEPSHESTPLGEEGLLAWTERGQHVLAMGGIDPSSAKRALELGALGVAGIDVFFGDAERVAKNALELAALFPSGA